MSVRPIFIFLAVAASSFAADEPGGLPPYVTPVNATNTLRLWGSASLADVAENWIENFRKLHPEIAVEFRLDGTGLAMPGIYSGAADIGLFGREPNRTDNDAFEHSLNYRPLRLEVATGSLDAPGHSCAPVIFVHRDNPLARVTLAQLDALFGYERRRGVEKPIRIWGDFGLTGEWAARPIHLYAPDTRSGPGSFFQQVVLKDSAKWNWERVTEFTDAKNSNGTVRRAAARVLAALATDPAPAREPSFVLPTRETVASRAYPLARPIIICLNRRPAQPLESNVAAFLRYVLSAEGQEDIARSGVYLPLSVESLRRQLALLE